MGERDYMFIQPVKDMVAMHEKSELWEIPNCGHVCNIEQPEVFNRVSIDFINKQLTLKA